MFKKIARALAIAMLCGLSGAALATTGTPPTQGPQLVDGTWLNGLAGGVNNSYVYGLTGSGTNQATALQFPTGFYLLEADTVASGTGFNLPSCISGTDMLFYNNGASTATIYPAVANNPATAAQDTINNATSITVATHTSQAFSCAKPGVWFSK
jgi:hypothetical protein